MKDFYNPEQRNWQDRHGTRRLADLEVQVIVHDTITAEDKAFIEARDMFFLSTVDERGWPTCSYKGGDPGFVRVLDGKTIAFPAYNGNGMYMSLGNVSANGRVGILFIDFENPHRLRLHGRASVSADDPLLTEYHEAEQIVRVTVENMFINCPRYIHRMKKIEHSGYVPNRACRTPVPDWKKIPEVQAVLPDADRRRLEEEKGR
ncbi:MAG TPA: pyridoxamine 5'-phosphate oxidase family protein [Gammaproteobacteria bacterium]